MHVQRKELMAGSDSTYRFVMLSSARGDSAVDLEFDGHRVRVDPAELERDVLQWINGSAISTRFSGPALVDGHQCRIEVLVDCGLRPPMMTLRIQDASGELESERTFEITHSEQDAILALLSVADEHAYS